MADEEETREVLFPDWEGPDKTGLTIERTSEGEIFVKEVKGESPAARSGKVYEGDQIVGATIYFDNMSSEETSDLLKTLNRHKVGLKLQNKGDKSPCCSPLSTPCRSPMGTLTWEGKTRFGGSSPDIILSGDDEDYKRIYTKKIKPRLKSEDLAEGVDVRTERHSSTSSDGSTITTITRRITTYTVDMPGGISEELSSPEFKGLRHESGDGSPRFRISHGSPSGKEGTEEGDFESSNVSYSGPHLSSTETHWGSGDVKTTTITREKEKDRNTGLGFKGPNFGITGGSQGDFEISRGSGEQGGGSFQVSGTSMTLGDSTNTGSWHVTKGELGGAEVISTDEGSISMSLPGKGIQILTTSIDKTQEGSVETSLGERKKVRVSEITISHPQAKGSGSIDIPKVRQGEDSIDIDTELTGGRIGGSAKTLGSVSSGYSTGQGKISMAGVDVTVPKTEGELKAPKVDFKGPNVNIEGKEVDLPQIKIPSSGTPGVAVKTPQVVVGSSGVKIKGPKMPGVDITLEGQKVEREVDIKIPKIEGDVGSPKAGIKIKAPEVDINAQEIDIKTPSGNIKGSKFVVSPFSGTKVSMPNVDLSSKGPKLKSDVDISAPTKVDIQGPEFDIAGPKGGFEMPKIKKPSFSLKGPKVEGPDVDIKVPEANIYVKGPDVGNKAPDIEIEGPDTKVKGPKSSLPKISGPNLSMPNVDIKLKGPKLNSDVELSTPKIEGDIKTPEVDIKGPEFDFAGPKGGFEMSKIKMPSFNLKGPKVEGPDLDMKVPEASIDVKGPKVDIKAPGIDIEGPDAKVKGPKFNLPTISAPKVSMPDFDWKLKGPNLNSDVEVSTPKIEGDIKTPEMDINVPDVDIDGSSGGFKMPKIKIPSFGIKGPKVEGPDVDIKVPEAKIEMKGPDVDIKGQGIDIEGPDAKVKGPKFNLPTISAPKVSMPDFDWKLKGPNRNSDVEVSTPKIEGDIKTPEMDINVPDVDIEGSSGGFKMPKFKIPSFGIKGPKVEGPDVDIKVPEAKIEMKGPDVDIKAPGIDIEGPDAKIKGPKFSMPTISPPKVSMPELDWKLKGPKLNSDVELSTPKIEGDIKTPEVDIKGPEFDIAGPKGGFDMPTIKIPSFNLKGPKVEGPDVDMKVPEANIDVKGPKVDIKAPGIDTEGPDAKIKGPKFSMPTISAPKVSMPELDWKLKGPKLKSDVELSTPKIEGDIKTPKVDIKGPEVDIAGPKGEFEMPKIKIPSFNLKGPKVEGPDVDMKVPEANIDVKGPKVDIKAPGIDIEGPDTKIKGPKFSMPTISAPKVSMPELDWKLKGPKLNSGVELSTPKLEGDIKTPEVDIKRPDVDIVGPKGGFEMPKIKIPSIGIKVPEFDIKGADIDIESPSGKMKGPKLNMPAFSGPKVSMPVVDLNLKGPKLKGDAVLTVPEIEGDLKTPEVKLKGHDIDFESPAGDVTGPKFKLPTLSGPKMSLPDVDIHLKGPKFKGELKGDVQVPKAEIEAPDFTVDVHQMETKKTKFKMPKFGFKGSKIKTPETDVKFAQGDIRIKGKTSSSEGIDVDFGLTGPKTKGSKFKMPKFGFKGPKSEMPEVDLNLSNAGRDIKTADVDIVGPNVKIETTGPKFKLPTMSGPKITMPDVDFNLRGPNLKGDVDMSVPKIEGDIRAPEVDLKGVDIDVEGTKGGFDMPKFKMPSFGMKAATLEGPDVNVKLPKGNIDVDTPKIDIEVPQFDVEGPNAKLKGPTINLPSLSGPNLPGWDISRKGLRVKGDVDVSVPKIEGDIKAPKVDIEGPDVDIKSPSGKITGPKFKMPNISGPKIHMPSVDFNLRGPNLKGDVDMSVPKIEGDIRAPEVDLKGADIDIEEPKGGFNIPKFKMPSFGMKDATLEGPDVNVKLPKANIDVDAPKIDIEGPQFDIEGPDAKLKRPKMNLPSLSGPNLPGWDISLKGPKVKGDVDVSVPKIEGDIKAPKVDIEGPEFEMKSPSGKIKGPKFKMPTISGPNINMPSVDFNLKGPNLKGDVDMSVPKIEGDIRAPEVDFKGADIDIEGPKGGFNIPKFKMPSFGMKGATLEGPDVNVKLPKANIDVDAPKIDIEGPQFDMEGPNAKVKGPKINLPSLSGPKLPGWDISLKGPKVKGDVDVSVPKIEGDLTAPKVDIQGPDVDFERQKGGFKMPTFKMPSFGFQGQSVEGPDVNVSLPESEIDIKAPELDIKGPQVELECPTGQIKGSKFKMPNISGPNISMPDFKGDVDLSVAKIEKDIRVPEVDIRVPQIDVDGSNRGFDMPKFNMPSLNIKGPKMEGPNIDTKLPNANIDLKAPDIDFKAPEINIEGPDATITGPKVKIPAIKGPTLPDFDMNLKGDTSFSPPHIEADIKPPAIDIKGPQVEGFKGGIEIPSLNIKGPKLEGPAIDLNLPKSNIDFKAPDVNLKGRKIKCEMDASMHKLEGDIKDPNANIKTPTITIEGGKTGVTFPKFKGPKFGMKSLEVGGPESMVKKPMISVGAKGSRTEVQLPDNEASLDAPDFDVNVKGKKGKFKLPKVKATAKKHDLDIETPAVSLDVETHNINAKGTKVKKPLFGKLHFPDVELDIKSPKVKGDGSFSEGLKSPDIELPSASLNTNIEGSGIDRPNFSLEASDVKLKTPNIKLTNVKGGAEIDPHISGGSSHGSHQYPEGTVTFPKIKVPKFGIALPELEGQEHGRNVESELLSSGGINLQSPSVSCQASSQDVEAPSPELKYREGKVKVKMPKLFGKSKAKGGSAGDIRVPEVALSTSGKGSKDLNVHTGEVMGGKLELGDPGLGVSTKGKSASLDLFKKSRHRSSLSDEGGLAVSSPSIHLEAEGGDIPLDLGGTKVKGKKSKLKFGTFGGFGSKSKGSYEVTLGEESEREVEGSTSLPQPSKKSRLSSSSSSDSGSRGGFRFPRLELSVSPKK